jgi:hypothetical protein
MKQPMLRIGFMIVLLSVGGLLYPPWAGASGKGRVPELIQKTVRRADRQVIKHSSRTTVGKSSQQAFDSFSKRFNTASIGNTPKGMGSVSLPPVQKGDGTVHHTAYNKQARVHFSYDQRPDGTITNRHWTDHSTGKNKRVGDKD